MKTYIASVSLSGTLREKIEAAAAAGFSGIEVFENDLLTFDGTAQDVSRLVRDLGMEIVVLQPFRDFEGMPEPQRTRTFDRLERKFDLMQQLGTDLLLVCSNVSPLSMGGISRAAEDFHELGVRAARRGLRAGFEALAWGRHISDYRDAWEVVRRADHPAVGIIVDSFHVFSRVHDLGALESIPEDRIFLIHLADAPLMKMDHLYWSRHFRCFPGQGEFPMVSFMRAVAVTQYHGPLSLEIFNDHFRAASTRQTAIDGRRSMILLLEQAGIEILSPTARLGGVEFLEFAVEETQAAELRKLFAGFGFSEAGRHRSKDVQLWSQSGVNLVLNTESEGFAHEYSGVHGPSVCAMGLRVDDAKLAEARAKAYLCQPFRHPVGRGEVEIPAIRGFDGSLLYLIDPTMGAGRSIWEVDFVLNFEVLRRESAGLEGIDHIAQITSQEELASAVLFYRAVLGLQPAPVFEVPDPHGLMQVRVMENMDRTVRIALCAPQSQGTMAARFLSEYAGSGVHQIGFRSRDIFQTVRRLEINGVDLLPIPGNYYDDLEARFGLEPAMLDSLRQHNVLYDRNDQGEFLHAYTRTYAGRFFFEVVERRGYTDFGAANAAIRLAAQARNAPNHDLVANH